MKLLSIPRPLVIPLVAAGAFFAGWCAPRGGDVAGSAHGESSQRAKAATGSHRAGRASPDKLAAPAAAKASWEESLALEEGAWRDLEAARAWRCLAEHDAALAWSESFRLTEGAELRATLNPDAAAADAWIAGTPEEHRANASIEVASLLMKQSPEDALQWAAAAADPDLRHDMKVGIMSEWARTDPVAAAAWCDARTDGADCLPVLISAWAATDLMGASAWLAARPADAGRDSSTLSLIEPLLDAEPASALAWAQTLTDPGMRRSTEERIAALTGMERE